MNDGMLDETEQKIMDFCKKEDVLCKRVKGPAFDAQLNHTKDYIQDVV